MTLSVEDAQREGPAPARPVAGPGFQAVAAGEVVAALSRHYADDPAARPMAAGYEDGSASRLAWPCPACEITGPRRFRLTTPAANESGPIVCSNGCSLEQILAAIERGPWTTKSASKDHGLTSEDHAPLHSSPSKPVRSALGCPQTLERPRAIEFTARDAREVARVFGMPAVRGACPLPTHTGTGNVEVRGGVLRLTCGCEEGRGWTALSDAFAAVRTGRLKRLNRGARRFWLVLLAHQAGFIEPVSVKLGELPANATDDMRAVAADLALLIGLRVAAGDSSELPYSASLCQQRCGFNSRAKANRVINALVSAGVIVRVGSLPPSGHPRGTSLYAAPVERPVLAGGVEAGPARRAEGPLAGPLDGPVARDAGEELAVEPVGEVHDLALVAGAELAAGLPLLGAAERCAVQTLPCHSPILTALADRTERTAGGSG